MECPAETKGIDFEWHFNYKGGKGKDKSAINK